MACGSTCRTPTARIVANLASPSVILGLALGSFDGLLLRCGVNLLLLQASDVGDGPLAVPVQNEHERLGKIEVIEGGTSPIDGDWERGVASVQYVVSSRPRSAFSTAIDKTALVTWLMERPLSNTASFTASHATISSCMASCRL